MKNKKTLFYDNVFPSRQRQTDRSGDSEYTPSDKTITIRRQLLYASAVPYFNFFLFLSLFEKKGLLFIDA